ncbi:putative oxalocrotonate tautomerase enzyme domain-containing protein [Ditylenchus destructor]|nr:putative oxalocrotonate tautomerase enzyme domain-containing protein [Ditylenchus destructor]
MPLHRFYIPEGLYTEDDKKKLAQSITDLYTHVMPAFYVAFENLDRNLWRENGLIPPLAESEGNKEWMRLNKAVPYE